LPIIPSEIPQPDCVLLSHTHYDHLNISSYKYISCKVPIIVPEGSERAISQYVSNPIIELCAFAEHELPNGTKITAVPLKHHSSRLSHLRFTKTSGYIIRTPEEGSIFFCADSGYGPHFQEIGNLEKIDLALLPIGGYLPRWMMKGCHMTPAEALQAFEDLGAAHMVPIHHSTFRLSLEPPNAPVDWLKKILTEREELRSRVHLIAPGESFSLE
jgi:L-ascorbate metabolism protein UlaG (beta-lactamase superfamily)